MYFLSPSCLKRELKTRVEQLQCTWAHIISIFWCPAVSFATHSALSAWNTPCCLQKENLTLSIKTSTTQRWNTILLTSPSSLFSLRLSLSSPVFLSRCTELLSRNFHLYPRHHFFAPLSPEVLKDASLHEEPLPIFALKPQYLICVSPLSWWLSWDNIQNRS